MAKTTIYLNQKKKTITHTSSEKIGGVLESKGYIKIGSLYGMSISLSGAGDYKYEVSTSLIKEEQTLKKQIESTIRIKN